MRVLWLLIATVALCAPLLSGCEKAPAMAFVSASTPVGGVVKFSGSLIGDAIVQAQNYCQSLKSEQSAIPIGFYTSQDNDGYDQLMTFECKRNHAG